jgi:hypothetical protein
MPRFKQPRRILLEILHDKRLTVSLLRKVGALRQEANLTIGPFAPKSETMALWRIVSNKSTHPASRFKYLQELVAAPTVVRKPRKPKPKPQKAPEYVLLF